MGILALTADERVVDVKFTKDALSVALRDGRTITVPLAWYPRLLGATPAQRTNWRVAGGGFGIHWPDIDEPNPPDKPGTRFRMAFGAVPVVLSLGYQPIA